MSSITICCLADHSLSTLAYHAPDQVLKDGERLKDNPAPDAFHYDYPRLCYHADAEFHATLTKLVGPCPPSCRLMTDAC